MFQDWCFADCLLQLVEGLLFGFIPGPFLVLLCKVVEGASDIGKSFDESVVEVAEADEFLDTSYIAWFLPGVN
jgi:membrane protein required for beta-lactamase induction